MDVNMEQGENVLKRQREVRNKKGKYGGGEEPKREKCDSIQA